MDLTSRDGDWFLDELCSMSANVSQFLDMVKIEHQGEDMEQFTVLYKGLQATHRVYVALQVTFHNILSQTYNATLVCF